MNGNKKPWYKEYFVYDSTKALTAGSGVSFETINIRIDADANFALYGLSYIATSDKIKIKMKDGATGQYLIKDAIDIKSIAGSNNALTSGYSSCFLPFKWPRPHLIPAGSNFTVEASDFSGSTNTMRLALHGAKIRPGIPPWEKQFRRYLPFIYTFSGGAVSVSANSTAIGRIEIDVDANFRVEKIMGIRTGGATLSIVEGDRNREWSNASIYIDNMVGTGAAPNTLPAYRFIPRGSVIIVNLTDLSGSTNSIEVNLAGVKLYE
jgi:hypothetical protein